MSGLLCYAFIQDANECGYKIAVKRLAWADSDRFVIAARTEEPAAEKENGR